MIQYTSQLASAGARNSSPTRHTPPVRPRPLEEEEEEDEEEPRRSGKKRRISSSLLFTILAVSIFVIGAGFFIAAVMNPFGGDDSGRDDPDAASLTAPKLVGRQYTDVIGDPKPGRTRGSPSWSNRGNTTRRQKKGRSSPKRRRKATPWMKIRPFMWWSAWGPTPVRCPM